MEGVTETAGGAESSHSVTPRSRENGRIAVAFALGMAVVVAAVLLGRSYSFFASFLFFSTLMSLLWRRNLRASVLLISVCAAVPISISRYQVACNLILGTLLVGLHAPCLLRLPRWLYFTAGIAVFGLCTGSVNWLSGDVVRSIAREVTYLYNFFLGPFFLLPAVYLAMAEDGDSKAKVKGLLFCLILPSTLILVAARLFGTVANEWEASLHVESLPQGFLQYRLGRVYVNFLRTEVGFILAALICASAGVLVSGMRVAHRFLAGACLLGNVFLLFVTASFGSILASLCGLTTLALAHASAVGIRKAVASGAAIACLVAATFLFCGPDVKAYLAKRYEHRIERRNDDRLHLWVRAVESLWTHPEGVGWTMLAGDRVRSYIHNDYLVYAVSYGIIGGWAYVIVVGILLVSFLRLRKKVLGDRWLVCIYLAGFGALVAVAANSMTDHMNSNRWYFNVIWSLIWYSYFSCSGDVMANSPRSQA